MQWSATVSIVILVVCAWSVKGILIFSFCAIVAFIFAQNLLDGKSKLDFTPYFASKGLGLTRKREASSITSRAFPRGLKSCRHAFIRNILRDFVISWYENVAIGGDFILETRSLLEEATVSFYDKVSRTTVNSHTEKLCILLNRHLSATQTTKALMQKNHKNFIQTYRSSQGKSRSYQNDELQYLRNIIDLLLYKLVPPKTLGCSAGRFILREILAFKVLLPLVDTISDPDFVNTSIINILKENAEENPLTTSTETNGGSEINLEVSTSFVDYLDKNLELNSSNGSSKLAWSEPETKYKFENATVVQKDHSEIVELSMEASLQENDDDDNIVDCTTLAVTETTERASSSAGSKRPKPAAKEASHSSVINGFAKLKNDLFKTAKEQGNALKNSPILGAIHPSGKMFGRQLRKIQSSPVMKQSAGVKLGESAPSRGNVFGSNGYLESLSTAGENCASKSQDNLVSSNDNGLEFRTGRAIHESQSLPKFIPENVEQDPVVSSFEEIEVCDSVSETDVAYVPGTGISTNDSKTVGQTKSEILFSNEKSKPRARRHKTSFSSTDEWDSEIFEEEVFDVEGDFSEAGEAPWISGQADNVSQGDFAIHHAPSPCSMISIPSTQLMTEYSFEPYKSRYTVYVIEYKTQLWTQSKDDDLVEDIETSEGDTPGSIKRRYREFMELHHRLHCGSLAPLMKDIPKPNRRFNSPFFRLDQDVVEGRQSLLENYLKCLVAKPAILNSDDFKGFLGIGNESQTDFRRNLSVVPTLPNVPRIDKKLHKKVTKFIDHIRTLVDTAPVEGDKEEEYEDIRNVLGEDKTSPDEIRTFVMSSEGCDQLSNSCCNSENSFHAFIQQHRQDHDEIDTLQQTKELSAATNHNSGKTCTETDHADLSGQCARVSSDEQDEPQTNPLTRTVLNLSCHLLEKHASWVCLEPVQEAATAVFGCFIEWWMEGSLSELVTEEQWQYYLTLLTDTVWPGGELMKSSEQQKTEEEKLKTKEEAIQTLSNFFGVVLQTAVGEDTIESSAREIVESLQHAEINRQLLLDVLEVIMVEVFPELMDDKDSYLSSRSC